MELLQPSDYEIQIWKNGRGSTREIACDRNVPYLWRVSSATLTESGSFSQFPGYQRHLVMLDGATLKLIHAGAQPAVVREDLVYEFSGDARTESILDQPGVDLNVFCLRNKTKAHVEVKRLSSGVSFFWQNSSAIRFVYCADGCVYVSGRDHRPLVTVNKDCTFFLTEADQNDYGELYLAAGAPLCRVILIAITA